MHIYVCIDIYTPLNNTKRFRRRHHRVQKSEWPGSNATGGEMFCPLTSGFIEIN